MKNILKEKRVEFNKSLQEIYETTRIRINYLQWIEEDYFDELPPPVFTTGYIKEYAKTLGIAPDVALEPYNKHLEDKTLNESLKEPLPITNNNKSISISVNNKKSLKTKFISPYKILFLTLFIITHIAIGIYFIFFRTNPTPISISQLTLESAQIQSLNQLLSATSTSDNILLNTSFTFPQFQIFSSLISTTTEDNSELQNKKKLNLKLTATGKVWVQIGIDNAEKKKISFVKGDSFNYEANNNFNLLIGNINKIKIELNGETVETVGNTGETVNVKLPEKIITPITTKSTTTKSEEPKLIEPKPAPTKPVEFEPIEPSLDNIE